jgi:uncharacterized membrane protein HdeD (DUF308 family)
MSEHAVGPNLEEAPIVGDLRQATREIAGYWWVGLVAGIAWIVISLVILQFDKASITTVGILVGVMFLLAAGANFAVSSLAVEHRWVPALFGGLFLISAIICFIKPVDTFAGLADMLGFLFGVVGLWWMVRAFLERAVNPLWWVGLISGILMTGLAFWTAGQFFIHKAYVLLVFAGIWALMEGVTAIVRAFEVRGLQKQL